MAVSILARGGVIAVDCGWYPPVHRRRAGPVVLRRCSIHTRECRRYIESRDGLGVFGSSSEGCRATKKEEKETKKKEKKKEEKMRMMMDP